MRYHIVYSGCVQGVGFRYTAQRSATQQGVTGWVRNTHDGRVELELEGPGEAVDSVCACLRESFPDITDAALRELEPSGIYSDFSIRV